MVEEWNVTKFCRECGKRMIIDDDGIAYHLREAPAGTADEVDHDADRHHVALDDTEGELTCDVPLTELECRVLTQLVWNTTSDKFPELTRDVAVKLLDKFRGNYFS
jgi:hypothetical protein